MQLRLLMISHIAGALAHCTRSCLCGVMSYRDCLSPWSLLTRENVWMKLGTALMLHRCCTSIERYMVRRGGRACCVASELLRGSLYLSRMSEGGRGAVSCVGFYLCSATLRPLRTTKD